MLSLYRRRGQNQLLLQGLFLNLEAIQEFEDKLATKPGVIKYDTMIVSKAFKKTHGLVYKNYFRKLNISLYFFSSIFPVLSASSLMLFPVSRASSTIFATVS